MPDARLIVLVPVVLSSLVGLRAAAQDLWLPLKAAPSEVAGSCATPLVDGRVLVHRMGNYGGGELMVCDVKAASCSEPVRAPLLPEGCQALADGRVLLVGARTTGDREKGRPHNAAIWRPDGSLRAIAGLEVLHDTIEPLRLPDGRVLVVGNGAQGRNALFDPKSETWSVLPAPPRAAFCRAQLLDDGRVLMVHRDGGAVWAPGPGTWTPFVSAGLRACGPATYNPPHHLLALRAGPTLVQDNDSRVFDAATLSWRPAPPGLACHWARSAAALADGSVLCVGEGKATVVAANGAPRDASGMKGSGMKPTVVPLPDGRAFVADPPQLYVPARLADAGVRAERLLGEIREALVGLQIDRASARAEQLVALVPDHREGLALLAALYEARGDPRAAEARRKAGPAATLPTPATSPALTVGARAYVAASVLTVRRAPRAGAPAIGWLTINAPVEVLASEGAFARVRRHRLAATAREVLTLDPFGLLPRPPPTARHVQAADGWVHRAYLSPTRLAADALRRQLAKDSAADAEAVRRLQQILALEPSGDSRRELVARSLAAGYHVYAAEAARDALPPKGDGQVSVEVEPFFACRGDRAGAVIVPPATRYEPLGDAPRDACLPLFDAQPPCEPEDPAGQPADWAEAMGETAEQAQATYQQDLRDHEVEMEGYGRWIESIERLFEGPPWLRLVVTNRAGSDLEALYLLRYEIPMKSGCDDPQTPLGPMAPTRLDIPSLPSGGTVEIWVPIDGMTARIVAVSSSPWPQHELARVRGANPQGCRALCM